MKSDNNLAVVEKSNWTPEQIQLIKDTVAKNATDNELKLFLYSCQNMGLDPLKPGQIYFIKYGSTPGTIVVGIDGFRTKAQSTGKLAGIKRGVLRDENGKCTGAWSEVYRSDWREPAREEVSLIEYNTRKSTWVQMPETMIKKVAEAAALRMAFPDQLGGVYADAEMDQADKSDREPKEEPQIQVIDAKKGVFPEQPEEDNGVISNSYIVPYGPLAKQAIEECDPAKLREYIFGIEEKADKMGKPIPAWAQELIRNAEPLIAAYENNVLED
jgi:phage recombination protein Bet